MDSRIGRVTPAGELAIFDGSEANVVFPAGMVAGPDGNLWFTSPGSNRGGRVTTAGEIATLAGDQGQVQEPNGITLGADGGKWVPKTKNRHRRISPEGASATHRAT